MDISFFSSDNESEEGESRILVVLFHDWIQVFVMEFLPYLTLFKRGIYKDSDLLNLVGELCISLHLWKKVSKEVGSLPFRKEWQRRHFENKPCLWFLRIFHFLNNGEGESRKSEKDIMRNACFCNSSILSLMNLELDRNQIWQPYRRWDSNIEWWIFLSSFCCT